MMIKLIQNIFIIHLINKNYTNILKSESVEQFISREYDIAKFKYTQAQNAINEMHIHILLNKMYMMTVFNIIYICIF